MNDFQGNRLYLVCLCHPDAENGIMLGQRRSIEYFRAPSTRDLDDWFELHAKCPGGPDKFALAHHKSPNWDQPKEVEPENLKLGVKLALVK